MVLGHTTGFPNWRPRGEPLALLRDPGTRFGYSGEGYVYLQKVIERLTATPLDRLVAEHVLQPLGMTDSTFVWRDDLDSRVARGHNKAGDPVPKEKPVRANAASSLHTTAPDLARFVGTMLGRPTTARPPHSVANMLTPHTPLHGPLSWGLGWGLRTAPDGEILFWHWGDNFGYKAFAAGSPTRGLGIVVLTNGNAGLAAAERLVKAVLPPLDAPFDTLRDFGRYVA
jgi:CubicO group peptidase (beta-lactamase class C family)